jgi:hypothetical protein
VSLEKSPGKRSEPVLQFVVAVPPGSKIGDKILTTVRIGSPMQKSPTETW